MYLSLLKSWSKYQEVEPGWNKWFFGSMNSKTVFRFKFSLSHCCLSTPRWGYVLLSTCSHYHDVHLFQAPRPLKYGPSLLSLQTKKNSLLLFMMYIFSRWQERHSLPNTCWNKISYNQKCVNISRDDISIYNKTLTYKIEMW